MDPKTVPDLDTPADPLNPLDFRSDGLSPKAWEEGCEEAAAARAEKRVLWLDTFPSFTREPICEHCGHDGARLFFCDGTNRPGPDSVHARNHDVCVALEEADHMHRQCTRCRYTWIELIRDQGSIAGV